MSQVASSGQPAAPSAPAAAPAPQSSGSTTPPSAASQGALSPQVTEYLKTQGSELQKAQGLIDQLRQQQARDGGTLDKIRKVFVPDDQPAPDPIAQDIARHEAGIDQALQTAIEHERIGRPIPETIKAQIETHQLAIQMLNEKRERDRTIDELKKKVGHLSDSGNVIDTIAFSQLDNHIMNAMQTIYGSDDKYGLQKNAQYQTVALMVGDEIKRLKKEDPATWDMIRRQPEKQRHMVNWFVEQNMPPKARLILEQEHLRNTPMTHDELYQAHTEAKKIEDPAERSRIQAKIRAEMWSGKWEEKKNSRSMNKVYSGPRMSGRR